MSKRDKGRFIFINPALQPKVAWYRDTLFQFAAGTAIASFAIGIGAAMATHRLAAQLAYLFTFPFGCVAIWAATSQIKKLRIPWTLLGTGLFAATLWQVGYWSIPSRRSHVHITRIDIVRVNAGKPLEVSVTFQNDGDLPITEIKAERALVVANFEQFDMAKQNAIEDTVFDQSITQEGLYALRQTRISAHSSDQTFLMKSQKDLIPDDVDAIRNGQLAIYLGGRVLYRDSEDTRYADFCSIWHNSITLTASMSACHDHNEEP